MNTIRQPAPIPGSVCGTYTRQNAVKGFAPNDDAARTYDAGMLRITLYSGSTMNGSSTCTIATYTAKRLKIIFSGSFTTPSDRNRLLRTPSFCSSTTQATVRTRSEVQNGSSTRNSNSPARPGGCAAMTYATG